MRAVLLVLALAVAGHGRELTAVDKILNGRDDAELGLFNEGRFPYASQLRYPINDRLGNKKGTFICAGTLINRDMVLTTAWCAIQSGLFPEVRINSWLFNGTKGSYQSIQASGMAVHAGWTFGNTQASLDNNIALLQLSRESNIAPVGKLPSASPDPAVPVGTKMSIVGWGSTSAGVTEFAPNLKGASQLLLSQQRCVEKWSTQPPNVVNPGSLTSLKVICTNYAGHNKALCGGDFGAPLILRGTKPSSDMLVGIGAYTNCQGNGYMGGSVFTSVSHYHAWIKKGRALLRGGVKRAQGYRILYLKDTIVNPVCTAVGLPCNTNADCCTFMCDPATYRCWL